MTQESNNDAHSEQASIEKGTILPDQSTIQPELPKRRIPLSWFIVVGIVILLAILFYHFRASFIAAVVDGKPISRHKVVQQLEDRMGAEILDALINETLIEQGAAEAGVTVNKEDIAREVSALKENLALQGLTLENALLAQGVTQDDLETDIRFRLIAERLLLDQLHISDEEVQAYKTENAELIPADISDNELTQNIHDLLRQQKFATAFQEWLTSARGKANISYWKDY